MTQPQQPSDARRDGAAVLLVGGAGSGKTYSVSTLIECGLDVFILGCEPRFLESIEAAIKERNLPIDKLHWSHVYPATVGWDTLITQVRTIGSMPYESLSKIKTMTGKDQYQQFVEVYRALSNFKDERTGKSFGPVDSWGPDRALVIDSLTGLAKMSFDLVQGGKPTAHEGEWGVAMTNLENLLHKLTSDVRCFLVMLGHIEREPDPTGAGTMLTVGTLGRKLSPKLGRMFSEVVHCHRNGTQYQWSTITPMFDLKRRVLPLSETIPPTFKPIVDAWRERLTTRQLTATSTHAGEQS